MKMRVGDLKIFLFSFEKVAEDSRDDFDLTKNGIVDFTGRLIFVFGEEVFSRMGATISEYQ
jgi:hypothetical protein